MQEFKIGDKVKVVDEEAMLAVFVPNDAIREGTVAEISEKGYVKLQEDHRGWWYPANCLAFALLKIYTVREVLEANKEANGYGSAVSDVMVNAVQKILDRRNDPDYATYLELKERFEN